MIRWLRVKSFQKHRALKLRLHRRITTIVGPTDVGKSALLRALRWLCLNEPRGAKFLRTGDKVVSVEVGVDGHTVKRSKGKANTYHLDGRKFQAFGNDVPEEVASLLNVGDINFQGQIDSPFWFSEGASQVSRQLNAIVDLGVIDSTLGNLATALRKSRTEREVILERLRAAVKERKDLKVAIRADVALQAVEALDKSLSEQAARKAALGALLDTRRDAHARACRLARASSAGEAVLKLEAKGFEVLEQRAKRMKLHGLIVQAKGLWAKQGDLHGDLGGMLEELDGLMGEACPLCGSKTRSSRSRSRTSTSRCGHR